MSTYPSTNPKKRDSAIKVMLTPAMREKLDQVAEALGQTPATAASFAIGQWVSQQSRQINAADTAMQALMQEAGPEVIAAFRAAAGVKP
jgi:predicted transcriptional regulator